MDSGSESQNALKRARGRGALWERLRIALSTHPRRDLDLHRSARPTTSAVIIILLISLVCATGGVAVARVATLVTGLSAQAQRDTGLAHSGAQALRDALDTLASLREHPQRTTAPIAYAQQRLLSAYDAFRRLNDDVATIPTLVGTTSEYGAKIEAARRLAPLAMEGTEAGIVACDALGLIVDRLGDPFVSGAGGLTRDDLQTIMRDTATIDALFQDIKLRVTQLRPADLGVDPQIASVVATFRSAAPQVEDWLTTARVILPLLPALLGVGTPTNYLLEVMDSTELRPGGGFIGNYGFLTLHGGRLGALQVQDVDLLDAPYKYGSKRIPVPSVYHWFAQLIDHWAFRDSNLDADFPTAARYGEQLYAQEGGATPVQGVVAITPWLIRDALQDHRSHQPGAGLSGDHHPRQPHRTHPLPSADARGGRGTGQRH